MERNRLLALERRRAKEEKEKNRPLAPLNEDSGVPGADEAFSTPRSPSGTLQGSETAIDGDSPTRQSSLERNSSSGEIDKAELVVGDEEGLTAMNVDPPRSATRNLNEEDSDKIEIDGEETVSLTGESFEKAAERLNENKTESSLDRKLCNETANHQSGDGQTVFSENDILNFISNEKS